MPKAAAAVIRDQSPPLMMLGIIYAMLFNAGLLAVSPLFASGSFPVPSSTAAQIAAFFPSERRAADHHVSASVRVGDPSRVVYGDGRKQTSVPRGTRRRDQHRPVRRLDGSGSDAPCNIGDVGHRVGRFDG